MPNSMIHEKIGFDLSKILKINSYDYYLGLLAPDSPNLSSFAKKEERWPAHIRSKNLQVWRKNLSNFYQKEKNNYPKDFIIGYCIHILTDIVYDDYLYLKVKNRILKNNILEKDAHQVMNQSMDKYYFTEIEQIKEILKSNNTTYSINNISKELLLKFKNKQIDIRWNLVNKNKCEYIKGEDIVFLKKQVLQEVKKILT